MGNFGRERWRSACALCALLALVLTPRLAFAFDESMRPLLRQMSQEGVSAYQAQDYATASDKLESAWDLLPTAPIGLWSARALDKSGRLVAASERYLAASRAPIDEGGEKAPQEQARAEAAEERRALLPRVPTLLVNIEGADPQQAELSVAGRVLPSDFFRVALPVDPGLVEVSAKVGDLVETASATLAEGDDAELTLRFDPALTADVPIKPATPGAKGDSAADDGPKNAWQRPVGWIGVGVGVAGLALGTIAGFSLMAKYDDLGCSASTQCVIGADEAATHNTWRTVSTASLIAGGVLAAVGVTLVVTAPKSRSGASVAAYLTGAELGIVGSF